MCTATGAKLEHGVQGPRNRVTVCSRLSDPFGPVGRGSALLLPGGLSDRACGQRPVTASQMAGWAAHGSRPRSYTTRRDATWRRQSRCGDTAWTHTRLMSRCGALAEFHQLMTCASPEDLRRPTDGRHPWTNRQLLFHMVLGWGVVRTLLALCGRWGASVTAAGSPPPSTPVATHSIGSTTSARASCATAHSARDDRAAGPHHRCAPASPGRRDQAQSDTEHAHADRFGSVLRTHDGCSRRLVVGTHTFGPSAGSVRAPATAGQGPTPDFWHSTPSWRTGGPAIEPARGPDGRSSTAAAQTRRDHA